MNKLNTQHEDSKTITKENKLYIPGHYSHTTPHLFSLIPFQNISLEKSVFPF